MLGFTGYYKGKKISVMGSGMGMPSIGIYSYELFSHYGVDRIIRIGSAGAYDPNLKLFDVVVANEAYSESSFARTQSNDERDIIPASLNLTNDIVKRAKEQNIPVHVSRIHSSDVFYREGDSIVKKMYEELGCCCVEMESFALFHNAAVLGKEAACILTISDSLLSFETNEEREKSLQQMSSSCLLLSNKLGFINSSKNCFINC